LEDGVRDNAAAKGKRYLSEGRLIVEHVDAAGIRAVCPVMGSVYGLGCDNERWYCNCPARGLCAHLVALQLVTRRPA
jgi:hypothetical protein